MDLNKHDRLSSIKNVITDYQKITSNTYYSKELTAYTTSIDNKLTELAELRKKQVTDSTFRSRLKAVGKKISINAAIAIPTTTSGNFRRLQSKNEIINFFNGSGADYLGIKYSMNFSLGEALINLSSSNRFKIALSWSVLDGELTKMDWSADTMLMDKESGGNEISSMNSIKAGTRIGLLAATMISKRMAVGIYYSARPGIQFLMNKSFFNAVNGATIELYEVKPEFANFNLSHEFGLKIFFFEKTFINVFVHTGNYTWKNTINLLNGSNPNPVNTESNYPFKNLGFRIGF
jgi:hypothetical protein